MHLRATSTQKLLISLVMSICALAALLLLFQVQSALAAEQIKCIGTNDATYECLDSNDNGGPTYAFVDIAGNHPALVFNGGADDGQINLTIPFAFTLYDRTATTMTLSMNGAIKFGETGTAIGAGNAPIYAAPNYFIAPYWDDLDNSPGIGGDVYTDVVGTAPNRQFIIQWEDIQHYNNTGAATFQVIFFEGTNELLFQYQDIDFGYTNFNYGADATIGIKGNTGTGVEYLFNCCSMPPVATISNSTAIRFFPSPDPLPQAIVDTYATIQKTQITAHKYGPLYNDILSGDGLAVLDSATSNGTLTLTLSGQMTYTPNDGFKGTDTFSYHANDGTSNSNAVDVTIVVQNIAPVAVTDSYTASGSTFTVGAVGVLQNDTDAGGDSLTAVLSDNVDNGTLTLHSSGAFTYTPNAGFVGTDSFTYYAYDGQANSNVASVTIAVEATQVFLPVIIN